MLGRGLLIFVGLLTSASIVLNLWFIGRGTLSEVHAPLVEYKDFVTILLTALAVMIAIATVLAAMAAVWGYVEIREGINRRVDEIASKRAAEVATEVAKDRTNAMVPELVNRAIEFAKQSEDVKGDEVADEIGKEGNGNG
jgi:hypothetical protein